LVAENCPLGSSHHLGGKRTFRPGLRWRAPSMPHHAKPFFRTSRGWYIQIDKQQLKLADGPKNADTEAAAWVERRDRRGAGEVRRVS
jgi:hypothetical protein